MDLTVEDDLSGWVLKDKDELVAARDAGLMSSRRAQDIRELALRAAMRIEGQRWPSTNTWNDFAPEDDWPITSLPIGLDEL